ncbi:long-chain-fatty-acid--CoA ligase 6 [Trichonephila clavipes]|nr:long-chain-fatty-acid--CoA ligase 6 [Trichonephila clavipes]
MKDLRGPPRKELRNNCGLGTTSFLVAIVVPEKEIVLPWYKENLKSDDWAEICKDSALKQTIFEDMIRIGKSSCLLSYEQVKNIHLHHESLTYEDGLITPTSKMKREVCKKYFAEEIRNMYINMKETL